MSESLNFRVSSGIKDLVGKDLITDDFIAVYELVKNSYDAYATDVVITFEEDKIIIADNGKGMSLQDINDKWLFLAYSAKKDGTEDSEIRKKSYRDLIKEKRHYAGAKGVGRFSVDRLGKELILTTKTEDTDSIEQININWELFNNQNKEFEKVKINHESLVSYNSGFPKGKKHGVILEINKISKWDREKILRLKHSLEKLINPFSNSDKFNIKIVCQSELRNDSEGIYTTGPHKGKSFYNRDKVNGVIKNAILGVLDIKTTQISVTIKNGLIDTKIIDRSELIYHIQEDSSIFSLIDDLKIDLYYLNRAAKINFKKLMGIEPKNFGSIMLFKNGFRVLPYGKNDDDSWGLNVKAQQGFGRFLSTRELFGRVDITTENVDEFKEVSSRDGGLVKTRGSNELFETFNSVLKRLERYVVGVLWGEGFRTKEYFGKKGEVDAEVEKHRNLLGKDKDYDTFEIAKKNIGSGLDFVQIIKSLSSNKDIKIIDFNKDFIENINTKIDEIQPKFVSDINKIIQETSDPKFAESLRRTEQIIKKELERAEQEREEEERRRIKAEQEKEIAEQERQIAEQEKKKEEKRRIKAEQEREEKERQRVKAEQKRIIAELATERKEKERLQAENAKLKAENKAREEELARKKAERIVEKRTQQVSRYKASESIEYKDLRDSNHIIGVYSDDISKKILLLKRKIDKGTNILNKDLLNFIQGISLANEKISTITRFTTKSNFLKASLESNENIVLFISDYIKNIYSVLHSINIELINNNLRFNKIFKPIELTTAIDNILSNSRRKHASKVFFEFNLIDELLEIRIRDVGNKLSREITDYNLIFEEGITTTRGAGLGLNHVKRLVENDLRGTIEYNPEYKNGFELILKLKK